jgi:hypothetical protein
MTSQNVKILRTSFLSLRGTIVPKQSRWGQGIAAHLSGARNDKKRGKK